MSHGDLKGVSFCSFSRLSVSLSPRVKTNILIDQTGHARIVDFGPLVSHHLGPLKCVIVELMLPVWHGSMDESRAYRSAILWTE